MSEQIPEEATFPKEIYAAAGELIITWAGVESALSLLVARLIASHIDRKTLQPTFDWVVYVKVGFVTHGTSPKAALTQITNLLPSYPPDHSANARKLGEKILKIKEIRDKIAHSPIGQNQMMLGQGASRNKGGSDTPFIASEIVEKAAELKRLSNQLSRLIDVATKLSPKQRDQAGEQWYASLPDRG